MKKHIIIAGVPRAGKSTIAQRIAHELGYQHISMDSVIAGIEKVFPETGIDSEAEVETAINIKNISAKMAPFLRAMMDSEECGLPCFETARDRDKVVEEFMRSLRGDLRNCQ